MRVLRSVSIRWLAAWLCAALLLGHPLAGVGHTAGVPNLYCISHSCPEPWDAALRVGQQSAGVEELQEALAGMEAATEAGLEESRRQVTIPLGRVSVRVAFEPAPDRRGGALVCAVWHHEDDSETPLVRVLRRVQGDPEAFAELVAPLCQQASNLIVPYMSMTAAEWRSRGFQTARAALRIQIQDLLSAARLADAPAAPPGPRSIVSNVVAGRFEVTTELSAQPVVTTIRAISPADGLLSVIYGYQRLAPRMPGRPDEGYGQHAWMLQRITVLLRDHPALTLAGLCAELDRAPWFMRVTAPSDAGMEGNGAVAGDLEEASWTGFGRLDLQGQAAAWLATVRPVTSDVVQPWMITVWRRFLEAAAAHELTTLHEFLAPLVFEGFVVEVPPLPEVVPIGLGMAEVPHHGDLYAILQWSSPTHATIYLGPGLVEAMWTRDPEGVLAELMAVLLYDRYRAWLAERGQSREPRLREAIRQEEAWLVAQTAGWDTLQRRALGIPEEGEPALGPELERRAFGRAMARWAYGVARVPELVRRIRVVHQQAIAQMAAVWESSADRLFHGWWREVAWWADEQERLRRFTAFDRAARGAAVEEFLTLGVGDEDPGVRHVIRQGVWEAIQAALDPETRGAWLPSFLQTITTVEGDLETRFAQLVHEAPSLERRAWLEALRQLPDHVFGSVYARRRVEGHLKELDLWDTVRQQEPVVATDPGRQDPAAHAALAEAYRQLSAIYEQRGQFDRVSILDAHAECYQVLAEALAQPSPEARRPSYDAWIKRLEGHYQPFARGWGDLERRRGLPGRAGRSEAAEDQQAEFQRLMAQVRRTQAVVAALAGDVENAARYGRAAVAFEGPGAGAQAVAAVRAAALAQAQAVGRTLLEGALGDALRALADPQTPVESWRGLAKDGERHLRETLAAFPSPLSYAHETLLDTLLDEVPKRLGAIAGLSQLISSDLAAVAQSAAQQLLVLLEELTTLQIWQEQYIFQKDVMRRDIHELLLASSGQGATQTAYQRWQAFHEALEGARQAWQRGEATRGVVVPFAIAKQVRFDEIVAVLNADGIAVPAVFVAEDERRKTSLLLAGVFPEQIHTTEGAAAQWLRDHFNVANVITVSDTAAFLARLREHLTGLGIQVVPEQAEALAEALRQFAGVEEMA